jgi:hypothetical protein
MGSAKLRLYVAAGLFLAWIGYLAYLVFLSQPQVVLSKPQFMVASLHIFGQLTGGSEKPDDKVKVSAISWTADEADKKIQGSQIKIAHLSDCTWEEGWQGPGEYLLPLMKLKDGGYQLAPLPPSPGFRRQIPGRIYLATPQVKRQLDDFLPGK